MTVVSQLSPWPSCCNSSDIQGFVCTQTWRDEATVRRPGDGVFHFYFDSPSIRVRSIVFIVSMFVCLFVSLSVRTHFSKITHQNFTKFSVHATCGRGLVLSDCSAIRCVFPVLSMMSKRKSKTMRIFSPIRQVAAPLRRQTMLFGEDCKMAAPGRSLPSLAASCCKCIRWTLVTIQLPLE